MDNFILEACVDSVESALAAAAGGATRLELCANLVIGGTTPGKGLFQEIRKYSDIRIHALVRPRFGDFCYTDHEFQVIRAEVEMFRELGVEGIVIGILRPDGTLNIRQLKELKALAGNMSLTLHRAFDVCVNPFEALEQAISLGFDTILTSGQKNVCTEGTALLGQLVERSRKQIRIMVGSGVDAEIIRKVQLLTNASAFHMSGKEMLDSAMTYRKEGVNMGLPVLSEYEIWRTAEVKIREARQALEECVFCYHA